MPEKEFQAQVLELAKLFQWRTAHFRPAQTAKGWRTPVAGDGVGFPDLILLRGQRMVVAELKTAKGRVAPAQQAWLDAFEELSECYTEGGWDGRSYQSGPPWVQVCVWRPDQFDEITRVLR